MLIDFEDLEFARYLLSVGNSACNTYYVSKGKEEGYYNRDNECIYSPCEYGGIFACSINIIQITVSLEKWNKKYLKNLFEETTHLCIQ